MRDVTLLHPELQEIINKIQEDCKQQGLLFKVTDTLRTVEEQNNLYAQGRTRRGPIITNAKGTEYVSMHQWGVAFDFCKNIKGQEYSDNNFFKQVADIAKCYGLDWGGEWINFIDRPHLQMAKFSPDGTTKYLKKTYITPDRFKQTWITQPPVIEPAMSFMMVEDSNVETREPIYWVKIKTDLLNVRSGPGVTYPKVNQLQYDTNNYGIYKQTENWGQLENPNEWVCLDYTERI